MLTNVTLRRAALLVVAVVMSSMTVATVQAQAVVPGKDGKIVFTRGNQVYSIKADGSGLLKLTTGAKNYGPRWSPDGKRIAYVHEAAGARDIWVMNANGTSKKRVTNEGFVGSPAWSPDGAWLAYAGGSDLYTARLKRVRSTAPFGAPQTLSGIEPDGLAVSSIGSHAAVAWSPNGKSLAYIGSYTASNNQHVLVLDLPTGQIRSVWIVDHCCDGPAGDPSFSPDGQLLAFEAAVGSDNQIPPPSIEVVRVATRASVAFTTLLEDEQPAYAPSGKHMVLMNDATGTPKLIVANANGSGRRVLTTGYQPDWQRLP
jgi:Tol biopolymer transport system component